MRQDMTIADMSGGLRGDVDPTRVPPEATPECENVVFDGRQVRVRPGRVRLDNLLPAHCRALAEYHNVDIESDVKTRFVSVCGDQLLAVDATQAADNPQALNLGSTPIDAVNRPRLAQFNNSMYLVDGTGPVRQFFGINTDRWISERIGEGEFGAAGPAGLACDETGGKFYVCDPDRHRILRFTADDGTYDGWYGRGAVSGVGFHASTVSDYVSGSQDGAFNTPMDVCYLGEYLYIADYQNSRIQKISATTGVFIWKRELFDAGSATAGQPKLVVADSVGNVYTADSLLHYGVTSGATTIHRLDASTGVYLGGTTYSVLGADVKSYCRGLVVNPTNNRLVAVFEECGGTKRYCWREYQGGATGQFTFERDAFSGLISTIATALIYDNGSYYLCTSEGVDKHDADFALVSHTVISNAVDLHITTTTGEWNVARRFPGFIDKTMLQKGLPTEVIAFKDISTPTTAPSLKKTTGLLPADTYECCVTYGFATSVGAQGMEESAPSPSASRYMSSNSGLSIDISINTNANLQPTTDRIFLYVRCGITGGVFKRVTELPVPTTGLTATCVLTEIGAPDIALDTYVSRPPKGCSILLEWQGRMVYAGPSKESTSGARDILYISQWDHPECIAPLEIVEDASQYGMWARIGTDGGEITGLGKLGSYLLVMKKNGVWLVSGEPGSSSFAVTQISESNGCSSHETIQQFGGNLLVWLDGLHVWGFDGQQFSELGRPLLQELTALRELAALHEDDGEAIFTDAFAVYDPERQWYQLTFAPSGVSFVLFRHAESGALGWTKWSGQPDGAAIYAHRAATPGVYAGARASNALYLLNTGETDDDADGVAAPICWAWYTGVFRQPQPEGYKQLARCRARLSAPGMHMNVRWRVRANGATTDAAVQPITLAATAQTQEVRWYPPVLPALTAYQVGLTGEASGTLDIAEIALAVTPRGEVR